MSNVLDEIGAALTTAGVVGGASGYTLSKSFLPPTPDRVIAIFDTGGIEVDGDAVATDHHDRITFQIRFRGAAFAYEALREVAESAFRALEDAQPTADYVYVYAMQPTPLPLGLDQNNRPQLSWNFEALRKRST